MIERFTAREWRCLKNLELDLPRFGALIGPNDSGKSSVLSGILGMSEVAAGTGGFDFRNTLQHHALLEIASDMGKLRLLQDANGLEFSVFRGGRDRLLHVFTGPASNRNGQPLQISSGPEILRSLSGVLLVRFDADSLRKSSALIPEAEAIQLVNARGAGLPGVYYSILARGDSAFGQIRDSVSRLFPTVKTIRLPPVSGGEVALEIELRNGTRVRAADVSEGLLYYLAYAALPYISEIRTLLIEEPENGLHPARIRDIVTLLRDFSETSNVQVLMATHSPLVINELDAKDVIVLTRTLEQGTQAIRLAKTPNFEARSKVYSPGELWLSYSDGSSEAALLNTDSP